MPLEAASVRCASVEFIITLALRRHLRRECTSRLSLSFVAGRGVFERLAGKAHVVKE